MKKALFGCGGLAREISSLLREDIEFFVDDEYVKDNLLPLSNYNPHEYEIMIAIADPKIRKKTFEKLKFANYFSYIHPSAVVADDVVIGKGAFIGPFCTINTNAKIGDHAIINRFNSVGHDVEIKNYLSMMPGSILSGNNIIGESFYIGTNSCTKEKINICDNVTIGLNSGVVKDIRESGVYVGTPARKIK
jgi:sugar O-acyltransferase (sialic acid O-acetyltransferase NeuD family)